jgi:thiamine-phosphate pyrophosphorylase
MIIVISPEQSIPDETAWVNRLLEAGLHYFHVRKPHLNDIELSKYVDAIDEHYRCKLVIHDSEIVAEEFGINRLHYSEKNRSEANKYLMENTNKILSTSVHDIHTFNTLDQRWHYAFLSPVFQSISKPFYELGNEILGQIKSRANINVKLIGLGGITAQNYKQVLQTGADGVALLGCVWKSDNPVKTFKLCIQ